MAGSIRDAPATTPSLHRSVRRRSALLTVTSREPAPSRCCRRARCGRRYGPPGEHLRESASVDLERGVELFRGIGEASRPRPHRFEERRAVVAVGHEHEENIGKLRVAPGDRAEVFDDLLGEQSAEVTEEYEEGRAARQGVAQPARLDARAFDAERQRCRGDSVLHLALRTVPIARPDFPPTDDVSAERALGGASRGRNGTSERAPASSDCRSGKGATAV
jgi:hypothetical protein